jgi:hypothetical protein
MKFDQLKALLALFCSLSVFVSFSQYKHFTVGVFGTTNNFDCHRYYSSPGVGLQYNFKRVFSLNAGISREKIKEEHSEYNDLHFYYSTSSHTMTYLNIPVSLKATFGRMVLFHVEAGVLLHRNHSAIVGGYSTKYGQPDTSYFQSEYIPQKMKKILPFFGFGLSVPVYKNFSIQFNVKRSIFRNADYSNYDHFWFNQTQGFAGFTYSLGVTYNFNLKKDSKYTFTTRYIQFIKNN